MNIIPDELHERLCGEINDLVPGDWNRDRFVYCRSGISFVIACYMYPERELVIFAGKGWMLFWQEARHGYDHRQRFYGDRLQFDSDIIEAILRL